MNTKYTPEEQEQWARLIAYAWKRPEILAKLREDPKTEIERLKLELRDISLIGSSGDYSGIPPIPPGLEDLDEEALENFLKENKGIFGIMQFCCV